MVDVGGNYRKICERIADAAAKSQSVNAVRAAVSTLSFAQ
jgi:hypothetical protein